MGRLKKIEETHAEDVNQVAEDVNQVAGATYSPAVDSLLRLFSNYQTLYIDDLGGVYSEPQQDPKAKEYTNPYYNK